ncbi:MAG: sigma-70 family RNA polymerase sigma factor [Verrucomicrobiota bacterium]
MSGSKSEENSLSNRDGNEHYVVLVTEAQPGLRTLIRSLLPREADASDVLQETNLVLWRKREEFDQTKKFMAWACGIAANLVKVHLRKQYKDQWVPFDEELVEQISQQAQLRSESFEQRLEVLNGCIKKLPQGQRRMVELRYMEGASVINIAALMGRSVDAISMTLYRARQGLVKCVEPRMNTKKHEWDLSEE